jgi:hypothetical protein
MVPYRILCIDYSLADTYYKVLIHFIQNGYKFDEGNKYILFYSILLARKLLKIIKNNMSDAYDETKLWKTSVKIHWTGINVYLPQKKVFAFHGHWVNTEFPKHEISEYVAPGIGKRLGLGYNKDDNKSVFLFHIFLLRFNFYSYISVGLQPFLIPAGSGT